MSAPIWIASPPEVHSALLSTGPGPALLSSAATAWRSMSIEYASIADELSDIAASMPATWQGPSGESFVAAHGPYLAWLTQASEDAAESAAQHEAAATAHTGALAAMPTMSELAINHAVHGALMATNFFGINTIPIAANEADYARMWIQAATTMATYEAASAAAVAAAPQTAEPPPILKADAAEADDHEPGGDHHDHEHGFDSPLNQFVAEILRLVGIEWDPIEGTLNGLPLEAYSNPGDPLWWTARSLELFSDFQRFGTLLLEDPATAFEFVAELVLLDYPTHLAQLTSWLPAQPPLFLAPALIAVAPLGAVSGLAGVAGGDPSSPPVAVEPLPPPPTAAGIPATPAASPVATGASAASLSGQVSVSSTGGLSPATALSPSTTPPFPPFAVTPPGCGLSATSGASTSSQARKLAGAPDAVTTVAARRDEVRTSRDRPRRPARGDEFMSIDVDADCDPNPSPIIASECGSGRMGFAGIAPKETTTAAGLTTLSAAEFGVGPRIPMLPGSWDAGEAPSPSRSPGQHGPGVGPS